MKHFANPAFWAAYEKLPEQVRELADRNYALLKENPQHPSLHFKQVAASDRYESEAAIALWLWKLKVDFCGSGSERTRNTIR